jgi:FeS assembly SUF system protein
MLIEKSHFDFAQCDIRVYDIMAQITKQELEEKIIQTLKGCYDPEIPVDIFELGLIYEIAIDDDYNVKIKMTLTSPMCPVAGSLPPEVEGKVKAIPEVKDAKIELVWNPPWDKDMMSEVAKLELGFL